MPTEKVKKGIWERDNGLCWHCGSDEGLTIHHRINRGMGGNKSKSLDAPSNLVLMCVQHNGLMESDFMTAREARDKGWKVSRHANALDTPIVDSIGRWWYLGDKFEKWEINEH